MFNPEQKRAFFDSLPAEVVFQYGMTNVFADSAGQEEKLNRDVCTWYREELQAFLDPIARKKTISSWKYLYVLRLYAEWCVGQKIEGANLEALHVTTDKIEKDKRTMVGDPSDMQAYLDSLFPPEDEHTQSLASRGYYWMIYLGLTPNEAIEVTTDQVDLEGYSIRLGDRRIVIPPEAMNTFDLLVKSDTFVTKRRSQSGGFSESNRRRAEGNTLVRGFVKKMTQEQFAVKTSKTRKNSATADRKVTIERMAECGFFYRNYLLERAGRVMMLREHVLKEIDNATFRSDAEKKQATLDRTSKITQRYRYWKFLFNY